VLEDSHKTTLQQGESIMAMQERRFAPTVLALAIAGAASAGVHAQGSDTRATALEEVIVTAERRETSLQDTPISVLAFGAPQLEKLGVDDLSDLQSSVPNLSIRQFPNSQASLRAYIRGIGNNDVQMTLDPSVAVYIDGFYVARSIGLSNEVADLQRIEVLRGPQGSLYGRNSIGGAINMVTAKPTGELGLKQTVSVGSLDYLRSSTNLNLPKVGDFSAKLSLVAGTKDGQVENKGSGPNFGDNDNIGARVAVNWSPVDGFSADYAFDYSDVDTGVLYYQTVAQPYPQYSFLPYSKNRMDEVTPKHPVDESTLKVTGHSLTLAWEVSDALTVKSLTGYREVEQHVYQDYGANPLAARMFANDPFDNDQDQFSQEFQFLGSLLDGSVDYVAGLYYFDESGQEDTTDYYFDYELPRRLTDANNTADAVFGRVTWTPPVLEQRLHLTAGLRYSEDERDVSTDRYASGFRYQSARADGKWHNTSPDFTASFDITPDVNVYAKYVEGYKTGGFNGRGASVLAITSPVDEENITTIEAGFKAQFLDNRVRLNAAAFTSDYEDIQLSFALLGDPTNVVNYNAGKASIDGVELDLSAVLVEGLVLTASYGYLDTKIDEVINPLTGIDDSKTQRYVLPGAPENTWTLDLEYTFPAFTFGELVADVNYAARDEMEFVSQPRTGYLVPDYDLWNARLTLRDICVGGPGKASVALWGKNLADEEYLLDGIEAFPWSPLSAPFGEERTWGVDVTYEF
jgi:iron complex outermembrane recepter protein